VEGGAVGFPELTTMTSTTSFKLLVGAAGGNTDASAAQIDSGSLTATSQLATATGSVKATDPAQEDMATISRAARPPTISLPPGPLRVSGRIALCAELCQPPWSHLLFTVRCIRGNWPAQLRHEVSEWPGAQLRDDGQTVSFYTRCYEDIAHRIHELTARVGGAEPELLPAWVRRITGFGREDAPPALGMRRAEAERRVLESVGRLPEELQHQTPVLPYQVDGVAFGLHRGGRVLFGDEMGLGKTVQALLLAAEFAAEWPVLVVVPSSLRFVWRAQAAHWLPHLVGEDAGLVHVVQHGKDRPSIGARMVIGTYDLVRRCESLRLRPDGRHFLVVVVDESQNIKDYASQRTKAVVGLCKAARRAILLSGTPALNRAVELYTQLEAVLPTEMPSFTEFAERYCTKEVQRFGHRTVEKWNGVQRPDELNVVLKSSIMIRRLKKDVLEQLPPKRRIRVPLDPERMDQEALREVEKKVRLLRVAHGDAAHPSAKELSNMPELFRRTAEAKIGAVVEYVEHLLQLRMKFLLFGHHRATLDVLEGRLNELGVESVRIDGMTSAAQRPARVARFQEEEHVRVALLSITAAGQGLTLTAAQTVVFAELYWVPGQMKQAEDRAHRIGQHDCVTVQYLVANNTLDDVLFRALERKAKSTSHILDGHGRGLAAKRESPESAAAGAACVAERHRTVHTPAAEEIMPPLASPSEVGSVASPLRPGKRARMHQVADDVADIAVEASLTRVGARKECLANSSHTAEVTMCTERPAHSVDKGSATVVASVDHMHTVCMDLTLDSQ